jgi:hypothetical protein
MLARFFDKSEEIITVDYIDGAVAPAIDKAAANNLKLITSRPQTKDACCFVPPPRLTHGMLANEFLNRMAEAVSVSCPERNLLSTSAACNIDSAGTVAQ